MKLGCYKIYEDVDLPVFATEHSACFDIRSYLPLNEHIVSYTVQNVKIPIPCCSQDKDQPHYIEIYQGTRALIPTGLIFNIPRGYSVRIHARSGLSLKSGIVLANSEGVIDHDYIEQTYIMITNTSMIPQKIYHGDRIAQGELVKKLDYSVEVCYNKPIIDGSTRIGGFGSSGTK